MKATINQETNETVYIGEDKTLVIYLYDEVTFEPIDISSYTDYSLCLINDDDSVLTKAGAVVGTGNTGKFSVALTSAETTLLKASTQILSIKLEDSGGPTVDIEEFSNNITVVTPTC